MAKVTGKNLLLNNEEASLLVEGKNYELIPNQNGMFLLIDKELTKEPPKQESQKKPLITEEWNEEKQQVIGLIRKLNLSDLVEGKFEASLNEKQRKALLSLVATGKVTIFKLNESYKKGVYKVKEENAPKTEREKKESEDFNALEKQFNEYTLEQDGFLIIKSKEKAAQASLTHEKQIREGELRGIKSFDGNYYLIQNDLLQNYISKIISSLSEKNNQHLEELARKINASKQLTAIICEFLKEEGEILEKKKGNYMYIN